MRIVSVNISPLRRVEYQGRTFDTGIYKQPVPGPVMARSLGLDGDAQGDKRHHGGIDMALYAYTAENYEFWRARLGAFKLPWGMFGENLTTEGLDEFEVCIGDRLRMGEAEVEVSIPRAPCSTFAMVMQDPTFPKAFLKELRMGFYLRVIKEGMVEAGAPVSWTYRDPARISIAEVTRVKHFETDNTTAAARMLTAAALGKNWREVFEKRVAGTSA